MNITTIGIDLAKTSFRLVGSDKHGKIVLRKTLTRIKLLPFIAPCPRCLIGLEACSGAHYWARAYYQQQEARGKPHNTIIRALAFKWIRIIFRCWKDHKPYDE